MNNHLFKKSKSVRFSDNNLIHTTYSLTEYPRETIDHVLYRRAYNRISDQEMQNIYICLDIYKLYEMSVHKDAYKNNHYHTKPV